MQMRYANGAGIWVWADILRAPALMELIQRFNLPLMWILPRRHAQLSLIERTRRSPRCVAERSGRHGDSHRTLGTFTRSAQEGADHVLVMIRLS